MRRDGNELTMRVDSWWVYIQRYECDERVLRKQNVVVFIFQNKIFIKKQIEKCNSLSWSHNNQWHISFINLV